MNNLEKEENTLVHQSREYFMILSRQKSFIITFTASAVLTALALTYIYSEKYEAITAIFYRPQEVTLIKSQQALAFGAPIPAPPFKIIGRTIDEMLRSNVLLRDVVLKLNLHIESREYSGPWYKRYYEMTKDWLKDTGKDILSMLKYGRVIKFSPETEAIRGLRQNIKFTSDDSYVLYMSVRDKYPERGAAIVNTLANILVDWLRERDRKPAALKRRELETLLNEKVIKINSYKQSIQVLLDQYHISSIAHEIKQGTERLSELRLEKIKLKSNIEQIKSERTSIRQVLQRINVKSGSKNNIRNTQIQPEDYKRLSYQRLATEVSLSGLEAQYGVIINESQQLEQRLLKLPAVEFELNQINNMLDTIQREYVHLDDALQDMIIREANASSEVGILNLAIVPTKPVSPIKLYHVSLAFVLSLLVSIGLVFFMSYFNIRLLFVSQGTKRDSSLQPKQSISPANSPLHTESF